MLMKTTKGERKNEAKERNVADTAKTGETIMRRTAIRGKDK